MARAVVTFRSTAFNTDRERDPFINPGNYGDDLARRLIERLRDRGVEADPEPGQEDHGWYLKYRVGGEAYCFVVGYRPAGREEPADWIGWVERDVGFLASLLGRRRKGIGAPGPEAIHDALSRAGQIHDIRWHREEDFREGREEEWSSEP